MKSYFSILLLICTLQLFAQPNPGTKIPYCYDEITSPDFVKAVVQSSGVCLLPMGILEKHGPHLPLGTDIFESRKVATTAAAM